MKMVKFYKYMYVNANKVAGVYAHKHGDGARVVCNLDRRGSTQSYHNDYGSTEEAVEAMEAFIKRLNNCNIRIR